MKRIFSVIISISLLFSILSILFSCNKKSTDNEIKIVCTIFPYYDICSEILGTKDNIALLNNSGTDMHNYEPSLYDIKLISECDIFIYGGGFSEAWVENTVKASQNDNIIMIRLMDYLTLYNEEFKEGMQQETHDHDHNHDHDKHDDNDHTQIHEIDEHVWLSLENAKIISEIICNTLVDFDSDNANKYQNNFQLFSEQVSTLDQLYNDALNNLHTPLIFADRFPFRYLTQEYDLEYFAAFPGCSTETFASFNTLAFLINTVNKYNAKFIITIDSSNSEFAKTIADITGSKIIVLNSCQSITQEDINYGISYLKIMENNYIILSEAYAK